MEKEGINTLLELHMVGIYFKDKYVNIDTATRLTKPLSGTCPITFYSLSIDANTAVIMFHEMTLKGLERYVHLNSGSMIRYIFRDTSEKRLHEKGNFEYTCSSSISEVAYDISGKEYGLK